MSRRARLSALAVSLACATALSGCLTPHVQPTLSSAVVESRARAGAAAKAAACQIGGLEAISPVDMAFAFDEAAISEEGRLHVAAAARWLACNPGVEVVIKPDADNHGEPPHLQELAQQRAQATLAALRDLGAKDAVVHTLGRNGADPVAAPHLVINAQGRGW